MRPAALVAFGLLATALLAPGVLADHTYSHTYMITGRVVDANGDPASGVPVRVVMGGHESAGKCKLAEDHVRTDHRGDFQRCLHIHEMAGGERFAITVGNETWMVPADDLLRKSSILHTLNDTWPEKDAGLVREWGEHATITGRVLERSPQPIVLDGNVVNGTALAHVPVRVQLHYNDGLEANATARTDRYGDYRADFELREPLRNGTVRVSYENETRTLPVEAPWYRVHADVVFGEGPTLTPQDEGPVEELPPGSTTPTPLPALAGVTGLVLAALANRRRR